MLWVALQDVLWELENCSRRRTDGFIHFALLIGLVQILYAMFVKVYARTKYMGFNMCFNFVLPEYGVEPQLPYLYWYVCFIGVKHIIF